MRKTIYILLMSVFLQGCQKDILNKKPLDRYSDADVWSDETLIDAYLLTQYAYTPVMINDATTMFTSWSGSPMNQDSRAGDSNYFFGNSAQVFGVNLTMDVSDETKYTTGAWWTLATIKSYGIPADGGVLEYWENAYYTIRNINMFLELAPSSPLSEDLITLRCAEARFLRAYIYFSMAKRYGGVPLLTRVPQVEDTDDILYPKRNSEQEIYDFVIAETGEIAQPLSKTTEKGRASKWAALALRSRAALYAASIARFGEVQLDGLLGIPAGEAPNYYQIAYDAANTIITESPHDLYNVDADKVQNFKNIFLVKNGNPEAIMVKEHKGSGFIDGGVSTWSWDVMQCPRPQVWGIGNNNAPYLEMVEEFEMTDGSPGTIDRTALESRLWTMDELWKDRDPRFYASIWTNGTPWRDAVGDVYERDTVDMHIGIITLDGTVIRSATEAYNGINSIGDQCMLHFQDGTVNTGFGIMKYLDPTADNMKWLCESRTDYQIFRFAEVLLNFAEASFELGKDSEAKDAVDRIRDRAGMPPLTEISREAIRHERKVELAFENHRYWDLRRWREAHTQLSRSFSGLRYVYDYSSGKFRVEVVENVDGGTAPPNFPSHNYYFPITKSRRAANPNLELNPGY